MRRLLKELETWTTTESAAEQGIERLGPVGDGEEMLSWEAVINGRGVGCGYESMLFQIAYTSSIHPASLFSPPPLRPGRVS